MKRLRRLGCPLLICLAGPAWGESTGLRASACAASAVDVLELQRLLSIELPRFPGDSQVGIECEAGQELTVTLERGGEASRIRVELARLTPDLRARTLALAIAELVRDQPDVDSPSPRILVFPSPEPSLEPRPSPAPLSSASPLSKPSPAPLSSASSLSPAGEMVAMTVAPSRLRLTRDLSIGLGALTVSLLGAGIPLTVVGSASSLPNHESIKASGITFMAVGVLSLAGTITSLVLWVREHRAAKRF